MFSSPSERFDERQPLSKPPDRDGHSEVTGDRLASGPHLRWQRSPVTCSSQMLLVVPNYEAVERDMKMGPKHTIVIRTPRPYIAIIGQDVT